MLQMVSSQGHSIAGFLNMPQVLLQACAVFFNKTQPGRKSTKLHGAIIDCCHAPITQQAGWKVCRTRMKNCNFVPLQAGFDDLNSGICIPPLPPFPKMMGLICSAGLISLSYWSQSALLPAGTHCSPHIHPGCLLRSVSKTLRIASAPWESGANPVPLAWQRSQQERAHFQDGAGLASIIIIIIIINFIYIPT